MKKSLFAAAALTAIAGAAQAQSSVTVYGILDVGYIGSNTRFNTGDTNGIASNGTGGLNQSSNKTTSNSFGNSAEQTSRLGFKGTEDMGGGTSAFFTAEFQLYPTDGTLSGNSSNGLLNRQTFVGLKKNGIGQAAIGTQYTPVFNAISATDVGQTNNVVGSVIYPVSGAGATASNLAMTVRTANTLSIQSDSMAGFKLSGIYTLNNKNQTESASGANQATIAGGNTNASGWGLGLDYTWNKLYATVNYQSLKQLTTATDVTASLTNNGIWSTAQANGTVTAPTGTAYCTATTAGAVGSCAQNVVDNQFYVGATYDFGILKAYANYLNRKATAQQSTGYYLSRSAEQIGVRSYITPVVEAWASAGLGRYQAFGQGQPTANFNAWQLGSNYYLSKRTNLYAIYGQTVTSNATYTNYTNSTTGTVSAGASMYALGVRHTF